MSGVLFGFAIVGFIIGLGYLGARARVLGDGADRVLSRFAFTFATPALMFSILAPAHLSEIFNSGLLVVVASSLTVLVAFIVVATIFRWGVVRTVIGALASGYVNAGNLGLPIAVYVLGSATAIAPVMLFQLIVLAPVSLTILDITTGSATSVRARLLRPFTNPITIASLAGLAVSVSGLHVPDVLLQPFELLGRATVPVMLVAFGMSLHGASARPTRDDRYPILVAIVLKILVQPLVALGVALLIGLHGSALMSALLVSSLPTAQNVYVYATRYVGGAALAHRVVSITTVAAIPLLLVLMTVVPLIWA